MNQFMYRMRLFSVHQCRISRPGNGKTTSGSSQVSRLSLQYLKHGLKNPGVFFSPRLALFLYVEKLRPFGEDVLSQARKLYNSSAPCPINDRCPERLYTTLVSDIRASCPSNHLANQAAGPSNPICLMTLKTRPF